MIKIASAALLSLLMAQPTGMKDPAQVQIGAPPPRERVEVQGAERDRREIEFRTTAEMAVRGKLFDPNSATFQWPYGFSPDTMNGKEGYLTCGRVNGRNRFGGYVGYRWFEVLVGKDGHVAALAIAPDDRNALWLSLICRRKAKTLPPAGISLSAMRR